MIDAADVKLDGVADISRSLEGRAAGVTVQNVTGTFGTAPRIQIRGATSIYGNSQPLWIVDGVIQDNVIEVNADDLSSGNAETLLSSAIAGLNADDIESFQILRDGSATSIYGARAIAGVIVINTKKGSSGRTNINYTGEFTIAYEAELQQLQHHELAGADVGVSGAPEEGLPESSRRGECKSERCLRQTGASHRFGRRAQHRCRTQRMAPSAGVPQYRLV
jgi:TonB-dependent SusC/RagA subfamily outer membrane receptor